MKSGRAALVEDFFSYPLFLTFALPIFTGMMLPDKQAANGGSSA